jgi:hypothetical protein
MTSFHHILLIMLLTFTYYKDMWMLLIYHLSTCNSFQRLITNKHQCDNMD